MDKTEIPKNLIRRLQYVCDKIGDKYEETKPQISAKIFHQIGKHFKRTCLKQLHPDKISLIRCAGLFNSALARKPDNIEEIRQDLHDLCQYILQLADAAHLDADLIEHAEIVKKQIDQMRNRVNKRLKEITKENEENTEELTEFNEKQRIARIKAIQTKLTENFKDIMEELSDYCESVLGDPPCDYALVGMGSLARKEITPYSDFENMILLKDGCENRNDYNKILKYFRWLAVIFQIVLINLQETIIPSLAIPGLNDSSTPEGDWFVDTFTCGISFDGFMATACKMPLGNLHHNLSKEDSFELIKPVSVMVEYTKRPSKTGDYLREILMTNCFVSGSQNVYEEYLRQCTPNKHTNIATLKSQVEIDLNRFGARQKLSDIDSLNHDDSLKLNIKRIMYRSSTLFITALGSSYNILAASCFDIIEKLFESKKLNSYTYHKLSFAVTISCETRLRVYMKKNSQHDNISNDELIKIFLEVFGESNILKYFQAAYVLQCHICKILNIDDDFFYTKPYLLNISICWFFGFKERCLALIQRFDDIFEQTLNYNGIEECLSQLENEIIETSHVSNDASFSTNSDKRKLNYLIENVARYFFATGIYDICVEYCNRYLTFLESAEQKMSDKAESARRILGLSLMNLKYFDKALSCFQESLRIFELKKSMANAYSMVGKFFLKNVDIRDQNVISGITSCGNYLLQEAQDIHSALQSESEMKTYISVLYNIAVCLFEKEQYRSSLHFLKQALSKNEIFDENSDTALAIYNYLAANLVCLEKYEQALEYLGKSKNFVKMLWVGDILCNSGKLVTAISYFSFLLNHSKESCFSKRDLLYVRIDRAYCKIKTKNEGINDLKQAATKLFSLSTYIESDQLAQRLLMVIGIWHFNHQDFPSALFYCNKSVRIGNGIYNNCMKTCSIYSRSEFHNTIFDLRFCVQLRGRYYFEQKNYDLAISCYNKAIKIIHLPQQLTYLDDDAQNNISECIQTEPYESQQCLKKIIEVQKKISFSYSKKRCLKEVIWNLGVCQMRKSNWQVALKCFFKYVSITSIETTNTDDYLVEVFICIGECCEKINQFDRALIYFEKALITQRAMQVSYKTCVELSCNISRCLSRMNKFHEALHAINQAQSYYRQIGLENKSLFNICTDTRSLCIKKLDKQIRRNMPFSAKTMALKSVLRRAEHPCKKSEASKTS